MRKSITTRLAVLFAAVSATAFLGLGVFLAYAIENHFEELDKRELQDAVNGIAHAAGTLRAAEELSAIGDRLSAGHIGHDRIALWIARDNGESLLRDPEVAYLASAVEQAMAVAGSRVERLFVWSHAGNDFRGAAVRIPPGIAGEAPLRVVVALGIDHHQSFMALFERALWVAIVTAILLSGSLGLAIARGGMSPIRTMTAHARRISTEQLGDRLDTRALPNELLSLAEAFNEMLSRLDDSFRRLSNFSSDIAHELRTPLSNLLTETQVMLSKQRSADQYREVLTSNAEELEHLARMIADMLFLAKTDNGLVVPHREHIELAAEVRDLFDFYDAVAEEKAVKLSLEGNARAEGDRLMLRRAINNLLSNAIRHVPYGGWVTVRLAELPEHTLVSITNSGEPIPEGALPHLFERFYRLDNSRQRHSEGAGLGLAITRSIIAAHGGDIAVHSGTEGNRFEFWLPNRDARPSHAR